MQSRTDTSSRTLFDTRSARRLSEVLSPCFTLILQLRAAREFGQPDVLRERIQGLLATTERDASRAGASAKEIEDAKFAIVALIDETILSSDWDDKAHWLAKPLQLELYNRYDAGEAFFTRLEELRSRSGSDEVLEVYYLCMTLGFKGKYQIHDTGKLRILIEEVHSSLQSNPLMKPGRLSPHGRPHDQIAAEVKKKLPMWVVLAVSIAAGLFLYLGLQVHMSNVASDTVSQIEAVASRRN